MSGLMRTTSWSESKNHFFGQLTSTTLNLVEFVSHFDTAMDIQRYTYQTNQHKTRYATPDLLTDYVLIKEAREIYTRTIFYDIQEKICASITDCMSMSVMAIDGSHKFFIKEIGPELNSKGLFESSMDLTLSGPRLDADLHVADSEFMKVAVFGVHAVTEYEIGFKMLLFNPLVFSKKDLSRNLKYVVPTGRVKVPAGRYVVPTGKDNVIVSTGRSNVIPAGRTILVLVVLCLLRVDSRVSY
ncbi:FAR1 DNA binding domain, zinc finger, SWIM-type, MULE transposase domain containing protein [Tanacetum coccineum]